MSRAAFTHTASSATPARTSVASSVSATALHVNRPGDLYEQEADLAAEQVVSKSTGSNQGRKAAWSLSRVSLQAPLQRQCACGGECGDCKKEEMLQREATGAAAHAVAPPIVHRVLGGAGRQLDPSTRSFMESRFGHDFSHVRIFDDAAAARSARAVAANAYTVGDKIVFNQGRYAPDCASGRRLLAHELAHVVQQTGHQAGSLMQRDDDGSEVVEEPPPKSNSVLQQAFDAADARRWEVAARLANGLSPFDLKVFLSQYKNPELIKYLHQGALGAEGVGGQSAIAQATEETYKAQKRKEDIQYKQRLAKENGTPPPNADGTPSEEAKPERVLTVEEKKAQCNARQSKDKRIFPLLLPGGITQFDSAPIHAERSGDDIVVSQPLNEVYANKSFRREVKTLPLNTFTGGIHLAKDEVVQVQLFHSAEERGKIICVSGEEMLKLSAASDDAVKAGILKTAAMAVSFVVPGAGGAIVGAGVGGLGEFESQSAAVDVGLQDHIKWGEIAFSVLMQLVMVKFGPTLTGAVTERAGAALSSPYTRAAAEAAIQGGANVLMTLGQDLFNAMTGEKREITVLGFIKELAFAFVQGAGMHLLMGSQSRGEKHTYAESEGTGTGATGGTPASKVHDTPPAKDQAPSSGHDQQPATAKPTNAEQPSLHPHPATNKMQPEHAGSPRAIPKEGALAHEEFEIPGTKEKHEIVAGEEGFGRCSEAPCPAIPIVYSKELAENPAFQKRYDDLRAKGATDVEGATADAAKLAQDIEASRLAKAEHASAVAEQLAPRSPKPRPSATAPARRLSIIRNPERQRARA